MGERAVVKQSRAALMMELAYVAYMIAVLWILFPGWHGPLTRLWQASLYRWRLGREQTRLLALPMWAQEAAEVRGRLPHVARPFNLPGA
jgi:hypothetical protein